MLPKLSYVLLSHNRETYIRSALENALAQDYEGELEYIVSDDCSTDRTFDIIRETVAAYRGNRRVVVTQTPKNLHLAGNTNHALQFVTGDWIVRADDDDYSSYDRCAVIGRAIAERPDATAIATGIRHFKTEEEEEIRRLCAQPSAASRVETIDIFRGDRGPAAFSRPLSHKVWSMKIFRVFGDLPLQGYYIDDLTCYFRSLLLGVHVALPEACCVYARDDGSNMSRGGSGSARGYRHLVAYERFLVKYYSMTAPLLESQIAAYRDYMREHVPAESHPQVERYLADLRLEVEQRQNDAARWKRSSWQRFRQFLNSEHKDAYGLARCLPLPVFAALVGAYRGLTGK